MEDVCKTLLNTYNTNVLDSLDIDLQQAIQKEAECSEQNPNPTGKKREILVQLINNHYDKRKNKPKARFIGGPCTLTVHWLSEYKKYIYIFGEQHINIMDCPKFQDFDSIEFYFDQLIKKTDVFIDFFFEIHTFNKKRKEYPENYQPFNNMRGRLGNLYTNFKNCLQTTTRGHEDCKLARVHYFDIRTEAESVKPKFYSIFWYKKK